MTKKDFDKLSMRDLMNGAVRDEIRASLDWQVQARAAGWSSPVPSKLRAVEKCNTCRVMVTYKNVRSEWSVEGDCPKCHGTGTIERELTGEEFVEMAHVYFDMQPYPRSVVLKSGARVVLVEKDK